jgi:predicted phage replisome organizer
MSDEQSQIESKKIKQNHWLKLSNDFFQSKSIKSILKKEKDQTIIVFYMQLALLTVATDGYYLFDKIADSLEVELSIDLDYSIQKIKKYLEILEKLHLIVMNPDSIFIQFVPQHTGKKDISNERVARYRQRQQEIKNSDVTDCNVLHKGIVTDCNDPREDKSILDIKEDKNIDKKSKGNKKLTIDDCKTILSEYDGFSKEEQKSLYEWIDHRYLIRNEKYVNAGWKAILKECLNQSQSGRDICHVIHKSMTSGSDGIGWQGIRFDLIEYKKKQERENNNVAKIIIAPLTPEQNKILEEKTKQLMEKIAKADNLRKYGTEENPLADIKEFSSK